MLTLEEWTELPVGFLTHCFLYGEIQENRIHVKTSKTAYCCCNLDSNTQKIMEGYNTEGRDFDFPVSKNNNLSGIKNVLVNAPSPVLLDNIQKVFNLTPSYKLPGQSIKKILRLTFREKVL